MIHPACLLALIVVGGLLLVVCQYAFGENALRVIASEGDGAGGTLGTSRSAGRVAGVVADAGGRETMNMTRRTILGVRVKKMVFEE